MKDAYFSVYTQFEGFFVFSFFLTKQRTADCNCREACGLWDVADFTVLC